MEQTKADIANYVIGLVGGRFLRFSEESVVPEGTNPITTESLGKMSDEELGQLYGQVAGTNTKLFRSRTVAIESIEYQIKKLPLFDPSAPVRQAVLVNKGQNSPQPREPREKYARKSGEVFELLSPPDIDSVMRSLAPQARELILIMTEIVEEKGTNKFLGSDLNAKLNGAGIADRLKTRQDPGRILQYYKGKLIGAGLIRTS